jgi:hypothetical protein
VAIFKLLGADFYYYSNLGSKRYDSVLRIILKVVSIRVFISNFYSYIKSKVSWKRMNLNFGIADLQT